MAELLFVAAMAMGAVCWFTAARVPSGTGVLAGGVALVCAVWIARDSSGLGFSLKPRADTLAVCAAATALRLPALLAPAGFVGADGSLQAFLALGLLHGLRPAPIFLSGSSYEGSLKAHLAASLGAIVGYDDIARLLVVASLLLWFVFIASTMALARRIAGPGAGVVAGGFVALSPRFATVFSVSNAGPYADALGLGTLALAWTARLLDNGSGPTRREYFGVGALLGVAFWQQPIVISYAAVAIGALLLDALWNRRIAFLAIAPGLFLGRLPATLHDLSTGGAATGVMTNYARGAFGGLSLSDQIVGTLTWAFPVVFAGLSGDTALSDVARGLIGALCVALVVWFAASHAAGLLKGLGVLRIGPALWPLAHFGAALALVWLVASDGQYTRPRYFLPLIGAFAIMLGAGVARLLSISRALGVILAVLVLGWNVASNIPRMREGIAADRELRALAESIEGRGLKTGYADFLIAGPISMVTNERVTVVGLLGPTNGEHLSRQIDLVAGQGPDFFLTRPEEEAQLAHRFETLGVTFETHGASLRIFCKFSRRVSIEEVMGFRDGTE
ncbi:MAG: hypothetical protein JJE39_14115 [Vicinamibacteria bacterium]|nr:hypothetical protein [Vicinamibacteria bacterium]